MVEQRIIRRKGIRNRVPNKAQMQTSGYKEDSGNGQFEFTVLSLKVFVFDIATFVKYAKEDIGFCKVICKFGNVQRGMTAFSLETNDDEIFPYIHTYIHTYIRGTLEDLI